MARPLPNTKAPALAKNRKKASSVPAATGPCKPETSQSAPGNHVAHRRERNKAGGDLMAMAMTPHSTNSSTNSESVQAVVTATTANMAQRSQSFPNRHLYQLDGATGR